MVARLGHSEACCWQAGPKAAMSALPRTDFVPMAARPDLLGGGCELVGPMAAKSDRARIGFAGGSAPRAAKSGLANRLVLSSAPEPKVAMSALTSAYSNPEAVPEQLA